MQFAVISFFIYLQMLLMHYHKKNPIPQNHKPSAVWAFEF